MKKRLQFWKNGPKNIIIATLVLLGFLVLLHKLTDYTRQVQTIQYSTFLDQVEQDQVKQVYVSGQDVYGVLKDNTRFETVVPNNPHDWEALRSHKVKMSVGSPSNQLTWWYFLPFVLLCMVLFSLWYFLRQSRGSNNSSGAGNIFTMGKSRARMFMPATVKDSFDSVAGAVEAKEELKDVVDFLKNPEKYKRLGAKITRGVLLVGDPGNGKTLLARAVAGEANCPFFSVSGSEFIEVFVGVGASRVRDLFIQARQHAPSIIFIDEIDAVGRQRGSGSGGGNDEREQTLNQLLTEMDGFQPSTQPVIVIGATNRPDVLDAALLRPGRFDRRVVVPYPDLASREQILKVHSKGVKIEPTIDMHQVARGTPGFTGADLANLINEAAIIASKANQDFVTIDDLEEARDKIIMGKQSKSIIMSPYERKITAYHEAGHAIALLMQPEYTEPLHKITIIPRGSALGVTAWLPERDKYMERKEDMLASVVVACGGRAAEEVVFNQITSGASSDFRKATNMIRSMVCHYGMSDLGYVIFYDGSSYTPSPKMAERIDNEVEKMINACYAKACELIKSNRDKLEKLAQTLLEKETLTAAEVYALLDIEPRTDHTLVSPTIASSPVTNN